MLGAIEIRGSLGAGGMGVVYRAHDLRLRRDVAVKVLPPTVAADPDRVARFEREAQAVAALSHPNILAIHDFGRDGDITYAVMELLQGRRSATSSPAARCRGAWHSTTRRRSGAGWRRHTRAASSTAISSPRTRS